MRTGKDTRGGSGSVLKRRRGQRPLGYLHPHPFRLTTICLPQLSRKMGFQSQGRLWRSKTAACFHPRAAQVTHGLGPSTPGCRACLSCAVSHKDIWSLWWAWVWSLNSAGRTWGFGETPGDRRSRSLLGWSFISWHT